MRRLSLRGAAALLIFIVVAVTPYCRRKTARVETVEEDNTQLASVIQANDAKASLQLLKGFYEIEQGAWRWTKGQFSVTLKTPPQAGVKGAMLELALTVPEPVLQRTQTTTISAVVNGAALEPETFSKPGQYIYKRPVPASALQAEAVTIDFSLDKFLAAGVVEERELGVIVSSAGLLAQ
ncbi:MAG: hypothetical protein JJE04_09345 [Acidobacteriia bacterium]|nr:hypothetical protein [Terriglobia bacterium]